MENSLGNAGQLKGRWLMCEIKLSHILTHKHEFISFSMTCDLTERLPQMFSVIKCPYIKCEIIKKIVQNLPVSLTFKFTLV